MKLAKRNIERYFRVVGIVDEFDLTLDVLEKKVNRFFTGIKDLYYQNKNEGVTRNKGKTHASLTKENEMFLKNKFAVDYELYEFVRQRLYDQRDGII